MNIARGSGAAPQRIIYIEPCSGISGDMVVGALIDLGADLENLRRKIALLQLEGCSLTTRKCLKCGILATKFDVQFSGNGNSEGRRQHHHHRDHSHRNFEEIRGMIEASDLSPWVKQRSIDAFTRLARAEGKIHGQKPEEVHFHEVGALDSIIDIVGAMVAAEEFMPAAFFSGPVNVGAGTLRCRHGVYPAPGPATLELLKNVPIYSDEISGELTTPTGAALLATLVEEFCSRPAMRVLACGYGAGSRDIDGAANVLRLTLGEPATRQDAEPAGEQVAVLEANLDDMNPQLYGHFLDLAFGKGALDVYLTQIQMKKNRPGILLTLICPPSQAEEFARLVFSETTTLGIRYRMVARTTLERRWQAVRTEFGEVRIKLGVLAGQPVNGLPEYEDCRRLAALRGVPLKDVMSAASAAYQAARQDPKP